MELRDTALMMVSMNYKERFKAEYYQVKIRLEKLNTMVDKWDEGKLEFEPTCPREIYTDQISAMVKYLTVLEQRAKLENVELN